MYCLYILLHFRPNIQLNIITHKLMIGFMITNFLLIWSPILRYLHYFSRYRYYRHIIPNNKQKHYNNIFFITDVTRFLPTVVVSIASVVHCSSNCLGNRMLWRVLPTFLSLSAQPVAFTVMEP